MSESRKRFRFPKPGSQPSDMARGRKLSTLAGVFAAIALAACQTQPPQKPAPGAPATAPEFAVPAGAREYHVIAAESLLTLQVYRGGSMAKLGHNHVIASRTLTGSVWVTGDPLATRFDIRMPVNDLTVDEPDLRERAGADFPREVPQNARDGTRKNLLSPPLLDAANYPEVRLRGLQVFAVGESYEVTIEVTVKDRVQVLRVPMKVRRDPDGLVASGEFTLRHSELGLTPFSIMMGAIVVQDEMRVKFEVSAR
jgi:polyisoprenoid-binding protein YceI